MSLKKVINGVSYGRVSTLDQAFFTDGTRRDDASPQVQKIRCQNYVDNLGQRDNQKCHHQIIEHLSDDGFSGKNTKRPGFQKLISYVKSGKIKFVIATELSRMSRNTFDFLEFFNLCTKHSVDVIIIGLNLDTTSPIGKAMLTILMAFAEFERNSTGERVKLNARSRLMTDGKINGACEILGLDSDKKSAVKGHFIINHEEIKIVKQIFDIFLLTSSRAETFREIKRLNIKWKHGKEFTKHTFAMMFKCVEDRYRGLWPVYNTPDDIKHFVKLPHGPIIDLDLLDQVEKKLLETKSKKRQTAKNHTYLLSTLLEYEDGTSFSGQPAKQRQYRYYYNRSNKIRIRCDEIEKQILKRFEEYISNDEILKNIINKTYIRSCEELKNINVRIAEIERDLKKLNEKESVIKDKVLSTPDLSGGMILKILEEEMSQINTSSEILNSELGDLEAAKNQILAPISVETLKKTVKQFIGQMNKAPNASHRGILEKIFHKIVIKACGEIELIMFGEIVGDKKATSSPGGINGGSNKT